MGLGIDPTNDYVFRLAFGDPANSDLLIHLLNAILALPSPIVEVEILNQNRSFVEQVVLEISQLWPHQKVFAHDSVGSSYC